MFDTVRKGGKWEMEIVEGGEGGVMFRPSLCLPLLFTYMTEDG